MESLYPRRRGPEWKQGWTGQTLTSFSLPPTPLLTIFGIVIVLLWLSKYTTYKAQISHTVTSFQLFLILLPIFLALLFMGFQYVNWIINFRINPTPHQDPRARQGAGGGGASASPWGIAIFVVLLLMLLSYQSSFQSKWFGPLWRPS